MPSGVLVEETHFWPYPKRSWSSGFPLRSVGPDRCLAIQGPLIGGFSSGNGHLAKAADPVFGAKEQVNVIFAAFRTKVRHDELTGWSIRSPKRLPMAIRYFHALATLTDRNPFL